MTNKTMPERIHVKPYKQCGCYRLCSDDQTEIGDVEYVRADLAHGDANEPLEDGQWRWVKVSPDSPWQIFNVAPEEDDFYRPVLCMHDDDGFFWNEDEVNAIGPVIRPPEDV